MARAIAMDLLEHNNRSVQTFSSLIVLLQHFGLYDITPLSHTSTFASVLRRITDDEKTDNLKLVDGLID